jgi:hypothetical protein
MTRLASFGPVFVAAAFPKSPRLSETSIVPIYVIVSMLNHEMKKRRLTTGPNDARRVVWARFRSHLTPASLVTWRPRPSPVLVSYVGVGAGDVVTGVGVGGCMAVWCWCTRSDVVDPRYPCISRKDILVEKKSIYLKKRTSGSRRVTHTRLEPHSSPRHHVTTLPHHHLHYFANAVVNVARC